MEISWFTINSEIELVLSWSKNCIISETSIIPVVTDQDTDPPNPGVAAIQTTGATFQKNNAKLYVLVVTLRFRIIGGVGNFSIY